MPSVTRRVRPLLHVALPVAVAAALVCLAIINIVLVKTWRGEPEDGVRWGRQGQNVVAADVASRTPAARAGIRPGDVLLMIDDREVRDPDDVIDLMHRTAIGQTLVYRILRDSAETPLALVLQPMPQGHAGALYYSLALVGILSIVVGASVRLRRPNDNATLHFFWLTTAFFGGLAFTASGRFDRLDYFFYWADAVAWLALPPLFLHFSLVFPERAQAWAKTERGRAVLPLVYLPALALGGARIVLLAGGLRGPQSGRLIDLVERLDLIYLVVCLLAGLSIMTQALRRARSVTARRQLRWIAWGSALGAFPFIFLYVVPFLVGDVPSYMEHTAVLLGCIPLAFASAIVRYRLMDIEVIVKRTFGVATVVVVLVVIYNATLQLAAWVLDVDSEGNRFWALLATLVVALVAPPLWRAIQAGIDRLYYRDRYDYRRALVSFARDLNSDLDLDRMSSRLVARVRETLGVDRIALFLAEPGNEAGRFVPVATEGFDRAPNAIVRGSTLGARLQQGQTVVIDDPVPVRRLPNEDAAEWRDAGLSCFVPCISKDVAIAVIGAGRRPHNEPISSEDMALVGAVAGQAATALENARLYGQLRGKADEIERLRQFSDSVVESLSDGLVVVDLDDRILRWNRRVEELVRQDRSRAVGRRLPAMFSRAFVETLHAARRDSPAGTTLYRVPLATGHGDERRALLLNVAIAPFQTADGSQAGWIIVLEDVTDRANLEEQLRLSEKMAAIGLLAAGVAHEVNTPLTGISSFTQMLLERSDPKDPRTELLEKIERQTFRAAKIINSLLNLARPSGGETAPVDLNAVIGDVLSLLEHQFKISRIQVRKDLAEPSGVVRGVEYKLQQVFLNLFLNARDAMPKGGWLSVTTRVEDAEVVIEVSDTGVGIPSEHIARIYDPFFTTKPEGGGTGLGLSVTYGIVQEHGGTLSCESDLGKGTKFRLALPVIERSVGASRQS
jgi:hypothetical protein